MGLKGIRKGKKKKTGTLMCVSAVVFCLNLFGFSVPPSHADRGDFSLEVFYGIGAGPQDENFNIDFGTASVEVDLGTALGGGVGFGVEIMDNFQLRSDVVVFKWDGSGTKKTSDGFGGFITNRVEEELRIVPIFLGGRFYPSDDPRIRPFVEVGLSVNFLDAEASERITSGTFSSFVFISESEILIGTVPGAGVEAMITPKVGMGVGFRYYFVGRDVGDFDGIDANFFSGLASFFYRL